MLHFFKRTFLYVGIFFSLFLSANAEGWDLSIRNTVTTYEMAPSILYSSLSIRVDGVNARELNSQGISLRLEILDQQGLKIGNWITALTFEDEQCFRRDDYTCDLASVPVPLSIVPFACTGKIKLQQGNRVLGAETQFHFQSCDRHLTRNSFLDLYPTGEVVQDLNSRLSVELSVGGNTTSSKSFEVVAFVLDKKRTPIWGSLERVDAVILPRQNRQLLFEEKLSYKSKELGCYLQISVNPGGKIEEQNFSNNDLVIPWGNCREIDENHIDLIPTLEVKGNSLHFGVQNIGDITVVAPTVYLVMYDSNFQILENSHYQMPGTTLEGFNQNISLERFLRTGTCKVTLTVDPYWLIDAENRSNNELSLELCD